MVVMHLIVVISVYNERQWMYIWAHRLGQCCLGDQQLSMQQISFLHVTNVVKGQRSIEFVTSVIVGIALRSLKTTFNMSSTSSYTLVTLILSSEVGDVLFNWLSTKAKEIISAVWRQRAFVEIWIQLLPFPYFALKITLSATFPSCI